MILYCFNIWNTFKTSLWRRAKKSQSPSRSLMKEMMKTLAKATTWNHEISHQISQKQQPIIFSMHLVKKLVPCAARVSHYPDTICCLKSIQPRVSAARLLSLSSSTPAAEMFLQKQIPRLRAEPKLKKRLQLRESNIPPSVSVITNLCVATVDAGNNHGDRRRSQFPCGRRTL